MDRDKQGRHLGRFDVVFPEKWITGRAVDFKGVTVHLSSPARFIFNKILFNRPYDARDVEQYAALGALSLEDVGEIDHIARELFVKAEKRLRREDTETQKRFSARIENAKDLLAKLPEWVRAAQK